MRPGPDRPLPVDGGGGTPGPATPGPGSWKYRVWKAVARGYELLRGPGTLKPGLRILCYHALGTRLPGDPYGLSLDPALFERQMRLLAYNSFGRAIALGEAGLPGPGVDAAAPQVCLTFDDGYQDALTVAAPLLSSLGLPFTVCVTSGLVGSGPAYLSVEGLKELARMPGAEIGAHGLSHRPLTSLAAPDLSRELEESRKRLEDWTGKPVRAMSYPHGLVDRRVREAAAAAGFSAAGCSRYGLNNPGRDPLLLCRTEIVAWDEEPAFRQKLLGGWDWYRWRHPDPAEP